MRCRAMVMAPRLLTRRSTWTGSAAGWGGGPAGRASRNRLEAWTTTAYQGGHILWLRGSDGVAGQIRKIAPRYQDLSGVAADSGWTHVLFSTEANPSAEVQNALEVLIEILTLQRCPKLDFGLALDWYKIPDNTVDSRSWLNTPNGELVHRGKYWYKNNRGEQSKVGMQLVQNMSGV